MEHNGAESVAGSAEREAAPTPGAATSDDAMGRARIERAETRDAAAARRDEAARVRDGAARRADAARVAGDPGNEELRRSVAAADQGRDDAASDRLQAANDRRQASEDRLTAFAADRQSRMEMVRSELNGQSGVFARELGLQTLRNEIDRCRRSSDEFVLAHVVIVEPKSDATPRDSSLVDDALVATVIGALRAQLRSYDPVVRIAQDQFLCGLPTTEPAQARARIEAIRSAIAQGHPPGTTTVGYSSLQEDDDLDTLTARAKADLPKDQTQRTPFPRRLTRDRADTGDKPCT